MTEEINPEEEEDLTPEEEEELAKLADGDDSDEDTDSEEDSKEDSKESELDQINKATGKSFKSIEDVAKSLKQQDKKFAEAGQGKGVLTSLYTKANPAYAEVQEEAEKMAKELGQDPIEVYEGSTYLKKEAEARLASKKEDEKNKGKLDNPTGTKSKDKAPKITGDLPVGW